MVLGLGMALAVVSAVAAEEEHGGRGAAACVEPPIGLVAWWPLDEGQGMTAADISGGNDGAHIGGPVPIPGRVSLALSFDGVDDYVEVADDDALDMGTGDFTIDAWVRTDAETGVVVLLDKRLEATSVTGYSFFLVNGEPALQLADGVGSATCSQNPASSSCTNYDAGTSVADGDWHFVAVTVDRDDPQGIRFYVDGVLDGVFDPTIRPGSLDNDSPLRLGSRSSSVSGLLPGDLDEVEIFDRALTAQEIEDLFAAGAAGKCKGEDDPCIVQDDGSGTVRLPPEGCLYLPPSQELHMIVDGLPQGTRIEIAPLHRRFLCKDGACGVPGGSLGGEVETFSSELVLRLEGTGAFEGFQRVIPLEVLCETHTGPRQPGAAVQSFPTDMFRLAGQLNTADSDFAFLQVSAGTDFGMPSPGRTTLTRLSDGSFQVDSFFDIGYRIEFTGAAGGMLDGLSGTTQGSVPMQVAAPIAPGGPTPAPCVVVDNGTGTITLPPAEGCKYLPGLSAEERVHRIIEGLPAGTTIDAEACHGDFLTSQPPTSGGSFPGGELERFDSTLFLDLVGTGELEGFHHYVEVPVATETHTAPRTPGEPVQSFLTEMFRLQGTTSDDVFAELTVTGGTGFGYPSPGETTLTRLPSGHFEVDSYFRVGFRIDFTGA